MTKSSIDKVYRIISDILSVEIEKVIPEAHIIDTLGGDELSMVEITIALEDEFDIEISDRKEKWIDTVQDLIDVISDLSPNFPSPITGKEVRNLEITFNHSSLIFQTNLQESDIYEALDYRTRCIEDYTQEDIRDEIINFAKNNGLICEILEINDTVIL